MGLKLIAPKPRVIYSTDQASQAPCLGNLLNLLNLLKTAFFFCVVVVCFLILTFNSDSSD